MNALLVWAGDRFFWVPEEGRPPQELRVPGTPDELARGIRATREGSIPAAIRRALEETSVRRALAGDAVSLAILEHAGVSASLAPPERVRSVRNSLPLRPWEVGRALAISLAQLELSARLNSPEEALISLAREEERVERVVVREEGAADQWVAGTSGPLVEYAIDWTDYRKKLEAHHERLRERTEAEARALAPNLSAVVGPRVAARLVAAAGGLTPLARMSAGRLQLLGARRRAGSGRGPRFGLILRAEGMGAVPADRQAAFARSLAALAVVAARADAWTHRDLGSVLKPRKERRSAALRARGRP